jgi:transcriptional regulator with XRE-family HTH domain
MSTPLLSAKLVELRQQFGYSQQDVADYLGMTREGYSHYERNAREPSLEAIVKISKLYQIDISELINEQTVLTLHGVSSQYKNVAIGGGMVRGKAILTPVKSTITDNINHFLKLFTGKNATLDLTDISKDDIALLAQYKKLDKESQKEVRQFIKFKHSLNRNKE